MGVSGSACARARGLRESARDRCPPLGLRERLAREAVELDAAGACADRSARVPAAQKVERRSITRQAGLNTILSSPVLPHP
eukprot:2489243-Pleurochrysis_carterae.AAC.1